MKELPLKRSPPQGKAVQARPYAESDQFEAGEEVADFEGGGLGGVGAVRAIVADAGAEVTPDSAGSGLLWVGGAHGFAPFGNGAIGFKNHGEDLAGTHEVSELAEERALAVDRVEATGLFLSEAHGFDGDDFEAGFVNTAKNLALEIAPDRIGFDDCKSTLD